MKTDLDLANSCSDIYNNNSSWTHLFNVDQDVVGVRITNDGDAQVIARGSYDAIDWLRDLDATVADTSIGHVHAGFYTGLPILFPKLQAILIAQEPGTIYIGGHSLGGGRAWQLGAMFINAGIKPAAIVGIAPPRAGFADFNTILTNSGVPVRGYHNTGDPVPDVPLYLPPEFPYEQPVDLISINAAPAPEDLSPLKCHHIALYVQGIKQYLGAA